MLNERNTLLEDDGIEEEILVEEECSVAQAVWGDIQGNIENQTDLQNALDAKQDSLTEAQLNAVNSGITSEKVTTYDGYADQIASKADQSALNAESTARGEADTALGTRIDNEVLARQQADNGLQSQIDAITSKSDVVDVVANYADLQAYDTQHLGDNDVIKVLDDETHGDALTYYRWSKTNQTWTFIGQEAPYYSKGQMDTMLQDKQDKLIAGANIQIAQDGKTISATDTTYTAGNGLNLNGTEFSADTTVLATNAALNSGLATKADKTTVQNLSNNVTSLDSRLDAVEEPVDYNRLDDSLKEDILNCEKINALDYIVDIEQGSIQSSTGIYITSTQRIRTTSTLHFNSDKIDIHVTSGYKCDIYEYSDTYNITGNYVGHHGWISADTTVEVSNNSFYRVVMAKTDDSTVDVDIISNFAIYDIQNFTEARAEQLQKKNNNIPKLIAHRGLTCIRSENTLPAYYVCSRYGIKYVKCDIQVTSDNKYVCSHQEKMKYPFVTPADNAYINALTLSQIQNNYYISGPMYETLYFEKLRMPSFEEALVCFRENNIIPFIDMKTGTDYKYVYNLLVKYGFKDNIYLFTSRKEVLNAFYALDKNIKLFYWGNFANADVSYLQKFKNADVGYAMDYDDLSADRVKMLHEKGIEVGTYPINDYTNIQNAIDYGCDYIQSDSCQFGLKSDFRAENLDFTPNGTGNYSLTIPDSDAWIFTDYLELEMEVYYESPYTLTITCGEKTLVDNQPNKWHKIKMQKIKLNNGISLNINCTDPNFMYLDRRVTLYTNKQG